MNKCLFLLTLFLYACAPKDDSELRSNASSSVDTSLAAYVDHVKRNTNANIDYNIFLVDSLNGTVAGLCSKYSDGSKEIKISKEKFYNLHESVKYILLYHEIGHCSFDINGHVDGTEIIDGIARPKSIMSSNLPTPNDADYMLNNLRYYLDRL